VQHQPTGAAFDLVLLLHTAAAAVGLASTVTAAATGARLRRVLHASATGPSPDATAHFPDAVRRYFRPGVNWVGRTVYAVPVLGVALVAMSHGAYSFGDAWVVAGVALFVAVALLCEMVAWPAERRLQVALGETGADVPRIRRDATALSRSAGAAAGLLAVAVVVMVAQP
jgi:hypothetical protein